MNRTEAQKRLAAIAGFREEQKRLEAMGLLELDSAARQAIRAFHDDVIGDLEESFDLAHEEPPVHWGMRIAATSGALALLGIAFAALDLVWGSLAGIVRISAAIAVPLLFVLLAETMRRAGSSLYAISLVAGLAGLAALGEMRLLAATLNQPFGPGAWALAGLFTAALGHRHESPHLTFLGLVLAGAGAAAGLAGLDGRPASAILWRGEPLLVAGLLLFATATLAGKMLAASAPAWRLAGLVLAALALGLLGRPDASLLPAEPSLVAGFYQILGPILLLAALFLGVLRDWRESAWGGLSLLMLLLLALLHGRYGASMPAYGQIFALLGIVALFAWLAHLLRAALARDEGRAR